MTVYVVGLVVFLAIAAIFLEFTFWLERDTEDFGGGRAACAQVGLTEPGSRRGQEIGGHASADPRIGSTALPDAICRAEFSPPGSVSPSPHAAYLSLVAPRPYDWKQK